MRWLNKFLNCDIGQFCDILFFLDYSTNSITDVEAIYIPYQGSSPIQSNEEFELTFMEHVNNL